MKVVSSHPASFLILSSTIDMIAKPALDKTSSSLSEEDLAQARKVRKNALKGQGEFKHSNKIR